MVMFVSDTSYQCVWNISISRNHFHAISVCNLYIHAQIIVLQDIVIQNDKNYFYYTRKFNKSLVLDFNFTLAYESWANVFSYDNVNLSFNNFLNT